MTRLHDDPGMTAVLAELRARQTRGEEPSTRMALADLLGVTRQAFSGWDRIPSGRVVEIADILGIPPHVMRPDIFPAPPVVPAGFQIGLRKKPKGVVVRKRRRHAC